MKTMIALLAGAMLMMATSAMALTIGPQGTYLEAGGKTFYDTGAQAVTLTDTDGNNDDLTAFLLLELAGYASTNKFGIYGYTQNSDNTITRGETLQVFTGADAAPTRASLYFNLATGTVENDDGDTANIGKNFGFYIDSSAKIDGGIFYTHSELNLGGLDYFKVYNTTNSRVKELSGINVVLGIEDLANPDNDFNDMVVGVSDVTPVPEPGTMMLLGAGFLGLAIYGKRRKNA